MTNRLKHAAITGLTALALSVPTVAEARDRAVPRRHGSSAQTRHPRPNGVPVHLRNGVPYRHHRQFDIFLSFNFGNVIFDGYYTSGRMFPFGCGPYGRYSRHQIMQMQAWNTSRINPSIYEQRQMYNGYGYANVHEDHHSDLEARVERLEAREDRELRNFVSRPAQQAPTLEPRYEPVPQPTPVTTPEPTSERPTHTTLYSGKIARNQFAAEGHGYYKLILQSSEMNDVGVYVNGRFPNEYLEFKNRDNQELGQRLSFSNMPECMTTNDFYKILDRHFDASFNIVPADKVYLDLNNGIRPADCILK